MELAHAPGKTVVGTEILYYSMVERLNDSRE